MHRRCWVALVALALSAQHALADVMYWTDYDSNRIMRTDLDTMQSDELVPQAASPVRITYDPVGERLYWTSNATSADERGVWSANVDGSDARQIFAATDNNLLGIALDPVDRKIYWNYAVDGVWRGDLDGSNEEFLRDSVYLTQDITIDAVNRKLYLSEYPGGSLGELFRTNLDGSEEETLGRPISVGPVGVAASPMSGELFVARFSSVDDSGGIMRLNYAGHQRVDILDNLNVDALVLGPRGDQLYFNSFSYATGTNAIQRIGLDGSGLENISVPLTTFPGGMVVVPEPATGLLLLVTFAAMGRRSRTECSASTK